LEAQPAHDESDVSATFFSLDINTSFPKSAERSWRRGSESNTPRFAKQTDNGFEDREGHQAPITLREKKEFEEKTGRLTKLPHLLDEFVHVRKLSRRNFRMNLLSINDDFKHAAAGRDQLQRRDLLL
jgi:hypothetical protein